MLFEKEILDYLFLLFECKEVLLFEKEILDYLFLIMLELTLGLALFEMIF